MKVLQTESMQTLMFDPGGLKGRLRACPFLGTWRALLCGEVLVLERLVAIWSVFRQKKDLGISFSGVRYKQLVRIAVDRCFLRSQAGLNAVSIGGLAPCAVVFLNDFVLSFFSHRGAKTPKCTKTPVPVRKSN